MPDAVVALNGVGEHGNWEYGELLWRRRRRPRATVYRRVNDEVRKLRQP